MLRGAGQARTALRGAIAVVLAVTALARPISAQEDAALEADLPPALPAGTGADAAFGPVQETGPLPVPSGPPLAVPSGIAPRWLETRMDAAGPLGLTLRFRFVAPEVAGAGYGPDRASADLQALCDGFALAHLPKDGPQPGGLVLDLADRVVPFGASDDTAVQFFEAYSIADGACHWELF
ncbi:DUF6497 family protein [Rhodobacter capsulatus]|uniref:DUF6497 family protein n=1 Tax=Rhodobacter capsulatus TaxID=1061 RepID=UPI0003D2F43C|nr:DUF6497 family protein [Rhodobacter capsulatus]ETD89058.1 hypothetical protein U713_10825 [Rhodobacter capsulatus YW2]